MFWNFALEIFCFGFFSFIDFKGFLRLKGFIEFFEFKEVGDCGLCPQFLTVTCTRDHSALNDSFLYFYKLVFYIFGILWGKIYKGIFENYGASGFF